MKIEDKGQSSIGGIPNVFPKLPKAPVAAPAEQKLSTKAPVVVEDVPVLPTIDEAPMVPEGGMLPADVRRAPESVGTVNLVIKHFTMLNIGLLIMNNIRRIWPNIGEW